MPAGGDIADRDVNPKFGHKIDFVDEMKEWFSTSPSLIWIFNDAVEEYGIPVAPIDETVAA